MGEDIYLRGNSSGSDMKVTVFGIGYVGLVQGAVLAEGPLDTVSADPRVIEVYLGR